MSHQLLLHHLGIHQGIEVPVSVSIEDQVAIILAVTGFVVTVFVNRLAQDDKADDDLTHAVPSSSNGP